VRRRLFGVAGNQRALDVSKWMRGCRASSDIKPPRPAIGCAQPPGEPRHLTPHDEIKFVLADRADYDWAREVIQAQNLARFGPSCFRRCRATAAGRNWPDWIIQDGRPVADAAAVAQVLWGNTPGK